ncbi:MAG: hypothetical protein ACRDTC_18790 [Pseudonocardiaceae bacterium]
MTTFHPPVNLPPSPVDSIEGLVTQVKGLRYRAERVMDTPVTGPRGQQLTLAEAQRRAQLLGDAIDTEEAHGSQRHRGVSRTAKALILGVVGVVDLPIMLWLVSSVFNVDWGNPLGLPLVISVVVSILATGGAATALYHLGHDLRQHKNHRRQLGMTQLTIGSKISLAAVTLLVGLIAAVMFVRVWTEGMLSGLDSLARLLALLVAVVMLISAWLVFWIAFRDGSPEQDDLAYYTRLVQRHLHVRRGFEDSAHQLEDQIELINRSTARYLQQAAGPMGYGVNGYTLNRAVPAETTALTSSPALAGQNGNGADLAVKSSE